MVAVVYRQGFFKSTFLFWTWFKCFKNIVVQTDLIFTLFLLVTNNRITQTYFFIIN